ncbi:MAG: DUF4266 domain-containing protein [Nitrosomonas sp.]|nr:MAG: DUF4266 domain-containing protein [Nitrosomonas sp.]
MRFLYTILIFLAVYAISGCTHVAVWERGNLAKPQMSVDPYPLQSTIRMHSYSSREAAASTYSSEGGGGCGCY